MKTQLHMHPDGIVYLRVPGQPIYVDTRDHFLADLAAAGIADPAAFPAAGFCYTAGEGREPIDEEGRHGPSDGAVWPEGEAILAGAATLLSARFDREHPPPTLAEALSQALQEIDGAAEGARLRTITPGAGQALTYLEKERDARAYAAAGYPAAQLAQYPFVDGERRVMGTTGREAADFIIATADAWRAQAAAIDRERRKGKIAVEAAEDLAAVEAARDAALEALAAL